MKTRNFYLTLKAGVSIIFCSTHVLADKPRELQDFELENSGINVLYVKSDTFLDNPGFRNAVSGITNGSTTFFDASPATGSTPSVDLMSQYDCVMIHTNTGYGNATLLGNNLADYVDATGGVVVFSDGFIRQLGPNGGKITNAGYSPVLEAREVLNHNLFSPSYVGDGVTLLFDDITSFRSTVNNRDGDVPLQGNGISDGTFDDGNIAAAYRPDFRVVYLNGGYCWGEEYPSIDCPGGDHPRRWVNACTVSSITSSPTSSPTRTPGNPTQVPTSTPAPTFCSLECLNGGECEIISTGEQMCICPAQTGGSNCEITFCPDGNLCLNGATCVRNPLDLSSLGSFCCDCSTSPRTVAGLFCEKEATSFCGSELNDESFCTNFGTCREPLDVEGHAGCDCRLGFEGDHCEYVTGTTVEGCLMLTSPPSVSPAPSISFAPSNSPSVSARPSASAQPSTTPSTSFPTTMLPRSDFPSVSLEPTVSPSFSNEPSTSKDPTTSPTVAPSWRPSESIQPSLVPSSESSTDQPTSTMRPSPTQLLESPNPVTISQIQGNEGPSQTSEGCTLFSRSILRLACVCILCLIQFD